MRRDLIAFAALLLPAPAAAQAAAPPAVQASTAAVAASTAAVTVTAEDRKRALLLVDLLLEEQKIDEAEVFARERSAGDPDQSPWLLRFARLASARRRPAEAAGYYKRLLELRGPEPELMIRLAVHALSAEDPKMAIEALERARPLTSDPAVPYYLAEAHFAKNDKEGGRRWAETALKEIPEGGEAYTSRMRLRMRAQLGWQDSIDRDFQRLYDQHPEEAETLFEWADALFMHGFVDDAREPLDLAHERFPDQELRWRRYESDRLRRLKLSDRQVAFLEESVAKFPKEPGFLFPLAEAYLARQRWLEAERLLRACLDFPAYERLADELLVELHRQYDHHVGPRLVLRKSVNSSVREQDVTYRGYLSERLRLEAEGGLISFEQRGRRSQSSAGAEVRASYEAPRWTAGLQAEKRPTARFGGFSPGLFGRWRPADGWSVASEVWLGRAVRDYGEAVVLGLTTDGGLLQWETRPITRIYLGGQARYNRFRLPDGSAARETGLFPEAVVTLLNRPFFVGLGYRLVAEDTRGDETFFDRLSLTRKLRTHYVTIPFGKRWRAGRVRTDGYVYNGHDDGRGRRFGSGDLVGFGGSAEWDAGKSWRLGAGYEFTIDAPAGIGGRNHSVRLTAQWHGFGHGQ